MAVLRYSKYLNAARRLDAAIAARSHAAAGWTQRWSRLFENKERAQARLDDLKAQRLQLELRYVSALTAKPSLHAGTGLAVRRDDLRRLRAARYESPKPDWNKELAGQPSVEFKRDPGDMR